MARTRFSLATCNLYNLNLPGLGMYRDTDGWDDLAFGHKVQWLAETIRRVDADVWGFQELWHLQSLRSLHDVYYTHIHQGSHESLDHILVSQELYDQSRKRRWSFVGLELVNDHLSRDDHKDSGTSDHAVVRAELEYRPV